MPRLLLTQRAVEPYKGQWNLPRGELQAEERLGAAAMRSLQLETQLPLSYSLQLIQVGAFAEPDRSPDGLRLSILHTAIITADADSTRVCPTDDNSVSSSVAAWFDIHDLPALAFDHSQLAGAALACIRRRIDCDRHDATLDVEPDWHWAPLLPSKQELDDDTACSLSSTLATAPVHIAHKEQLRGEREQGFAEGPVW